MAKFTVKDGTEIFYKDWGAGPPILFSHGWPLSSDMWDTQMMVFGQQGYRVVAPDRRGFGRSGQNWDGNTNEQFADDIAELIAHLGLTGVTLVAHSMAGGEACKYVARHGNEKLARLVMVGTVPPLMLKTEANPDGAPKSMFDEMRANVVKNRAEMLTTVAPVFFGFNKLLNKSSHPLEHTFFQQGMLVGIKPTYDCIAQFAEVDFTEDLKKITVPTLFIHGDADQIVPLKDSSAKAVKLVPNGRLEVISGGSHAVPLTEAEAFNEKLLAFITGRQDVAWKKSA